MVSSACLCDYYSLLLAVSLSRHQQRGNDMDEIHIISHWTKHRLGKHTNLFLHTPPSLFSWVKMQPNYFFLFSLPPFFSTDIPYQVDLYYTP